MYKMFLFVFVLLLSICVVSPVFAKDYTNGKITTGEGIDLSRGQIDQLIEIINKYDLEYVNLVNTQENASARFIFIRVEYKNKTGVKTFKTGHLSLQRAVEKAIRDLQKEFAGDQ